MGSELAGTAPLSGHFDRDTETNRSHYQLPQRAEEVFYSAQPLSGLAPWNIPVGSGSSQTGPPLTGKPLQRGTWLICLRRVYCSGWRGAAEVRATRLPERDASKSLFDFLSRRFHFRARENGNRNDRASTQSRPDINSGQPGPIKAEDMRMRTFTASANKRHLVIRLTFRQQNPATTEWAVT